LRYCTIEANYWQTRSIARPLCDSRATCYASEGYHSIACGGGSMSRCLSCANTDSSITYIQFHAPAEASNDRRRTFLWRINLSICCGRVKPLRCRHPAASRLRASCERCRPAAASLVRTVRSRRRRWVGPPLHRGPCNRNSKTNIEYLRHKISEKRYDNDGAIANITSISETIR